jgi:holo-[acyl-carrier protein] synthase
VSVVPISQLAAPLPAAGSEALARAPADAAGIDLVDLPRLALAVRRSGAPFVERVLGPAEKQFVDARDPGPDFGAIFGVKESVIKAVGGLPRGGSFHDVELTEVPRTDGPPVAVVLRGSLSRWARDRGLTLWAGIRPLAAGVHLAWALATPEGAAPATVTASSAPAGTPPSPLSSPSARPGGRP